MASDTTPKELGRLILGLLKGVAAEKAEKSVEPKIPFLCWFDEIGSYIVEGFGRLMSKSRSLGIGIIAIFQSPSQIDQVGKTVGSESLERREIIDENDSIIATTLNFDALSSNARCTDVTLLNINAKDIAFIVPANSTFLKKIDISSDKK